jgi:hypothetical protein
MNPFTAPGRLTSGRRTYQGNRLVGGVPNSHHLDGSAGDYIGTSPDALRNYFGSGVKIIPEGDHLHVQGLPAGTFPYYGNQGVAGLVNGVDTSAPKGVAMPAPKPRSLASLAMPNPSAMSMPVNIGADPSAMQAPTSLASFADLPQGNIPKPNHTRQTLGNIAGILGDALMAYGGMQPQFGPNLMRQQDEDRQMGFEREKLNAMLEAKRQQALEPPQYIQNAQAWAGLTPEQKRLVLQQQDAVNPINVSTPQGTQNVPRSTVKQINGKTYYSIGGEWYEESE